MEAEGVGDVLRTYLIAKQNKADFNLTYIGSDFSAVSHGMFDSVYMNGLFDYGYRLARDGTVWHKAPPGEGEATR